MLIDAAAVPDGSTIEADLCIVGAGPAGLTVALDLIGSGLDVVVLESGGETWDPRPQDLADGPVTGEPFRFNGVDLRLADTRMRQLGGSSNHWTGQCRPLDPHDLDARVATGGIGWPIAYEELARHYEGAAGTLQLLSSDWSTAWWAEHADVPELALGDALRSVLFQFSPPVRFGEAYAPTLRSESSIRVHLGATAVELVTDGDGSTLRSVRAATFGGTTFSVEATRVVLATGGVDVPRLLLASTGASPNGVGNSSDLVGRCFMDHPHAIGGRAVLTATGDELRGYLIGPRTIEASGTIPGRTGLTWTGVSPAPEVQDAEGIANGCVLLWSPGEGPPRGDRDADPTSVDAVRTLLTGPGASTPVTDVTLAVRIEQAPNPDSRVVLADERDELGMPRAEVRWRLTDGDRRTLRRTVELVAESIAAAGLGRIEVDPAGRAIEDWPIEIGNHHMGTTRMSASPADGVVDPDLRVHEVDNLYVCSSSVFPTSGMANPTLTIVALAGRLAEHLEPSVAHEGIR